MQISDDLISYITRELMKRLGQTAGPPPSLPTEKPVLHLVGPREAISTPTLVKIQEKFDIREHKLWDEELPRNASSLITSLSIQALVRVAEGDEGCTVEGRVLLGALLNGQPVAALKDGLVWRRYQSTAPKGLMAKYIHYENVLQSYGLKLVDEDQILEALLGRLPSAPKAVGFSPVSPMPQPKTFIAAPTGGRKVISENDLMAACPISGGEGQSLRLGPTDILTPLAQDYAKTMKINIVKG